MLRKIPRPPENPASSATLQRLSQVRGHLLELHRELMQLQRSDHERTAGPVSPNQLLWLLINAPEFAWLRPLSGLTAEADELLDHPPEAARVATFFERTAALVGATADDPAFADKYRAALQRSVDAAGIHAELRRLLPAP